MEAKITSIFVNKADINSSNTYALAIGLGTNFLIGFRGLITLGFTGGSETVSVGGGDCGGVGGGVSISISSSVREDACERSNFSMMLGRFS